VNEFDVEAEDGQTYRVVEYRKVIGAGHMTNPGKKMYGKLRHLRTVEGYDVSPLPDGRFHVVNLDVKARKII
jgi:hypothetical protein